jgi:hypothetical protein
MQSGKDGLSVEEKLGIRNCWAFWALPDRQAGQRHFSRWAFVGTSLPSDLQSDRYTRPFTFLHLVRSKDSSIEVGSFAASDWAPWCG